MHASLQCVLRISHSHLFIMPVNELTKTKGLLKKVFGGTEL